MKWRVVMILASGALAVSLLATDAQARGAEGYRGGHGGAGGRMADIHRGYFGTGICYPLILGIGY
jgi:hypothetical protein